jgi:hypothetical protein
VTRQAGITMEQAWAQKERAQGRIQKALERTRTALSDADLEAAIGDLRKAHHDRKCWSIVHTRLWQLAGEPGPSA